jgi:hypothetical protein
MLICPADERRISEVERGQSCEADVPLPTGQSLGAGDTVLFALSASRAGQPPCYVEEGDSILVSLTDVADLGATDPVTGQALVRLRWGTLGQGGPPVTTSGRAVKSRRSQGSA